MEHEVWKNLIYNGELILPYEVSSQGRIRNRKTLHIKTLHDDRRGYLGTCVKHNGKWLYLRAHRAVASTFIPNTHNKTTVNHINGNKHDNRVCNLEWNTQQENNVHSMNVLGNRERFQLTAKRTFSKIVSQYDYEGRLIATYKSTREAERFLGYSHENIAACARGNRKSAYGFVWRYKNIEDIV